MSLHFLLFPLLLPRRGVIGHAWCYSKNKDKLMFPKTLPFKRQMERSRWRVQGISDITTINMSGSKIIAAAILPLWGFFPGIRARKVLGRDLEEDKEAFLLVFTKNSSRVWGKMEMPICSKFKVRDFTLVCCLLNYWPKFLLPFPSVLLLKIIKTRSKSLFLCITLVYLWRPEGGIFQSLACFGVYSMLCKIQNNWVW